MRELFWEGIDTVEEFPPGATESRTISPLQAARSSAVSSGVTLSAADVSTLRWSCQILRMLSVDWSVPKTFGDRSFFAPWWIMATVGANAPSPRSGAS